MQVIEQLKRMNGMSVWVNYIKNVGVEKMTFSDWNKFSWCLKTMYVKIIFQDLSYIV